MILADLLSAELDGDNRCFDVTANLLGGFWCVLVAGWMLAYLRTTKVLGG